MIADDFNVARYRTGQLAGHYESYFQRANHPTEPRGFWLRYTVFSPQQRPQDAIGEIWAVVFDGRTGRHVVAKTEVPIGQCALSHERFEVRIGGAELGPGALSGDAGWAANTVTWKLKYTSSAPPLFDFPLDKYESSFPKAKALVSTPLAHFTGTITTNGETLEIDDWLGSLNHNWGTRHTDRYAWGQVCGFDNARESFLEVASARLKFGPLWSPLITLVTLRHGGREYACNSFLQGIRARGSYDYFTWHFDTKSNAARIEGEIRAPATAFVGLRYRNPPGGMKYCINTKIAECSLKITDFATARTDTLQTAGKAGFEILTDDMRHGIEMRA